MGRAAPAGCLFIRKNREVPVQQTLGTELVARQARNVRIFISAILVETIQGEARRECIFGQPVDSLSSGSFAFNHKNAEKLPHASPF